MDFFKNVPGRYDLRPYNIYHILPLLVAFSLAVMIFIFKNKLKNTKIDFRVRLISTIIAFSLEVGYHISNLVYHTNFLIRLIPLQLCSIALWLAFVLTIWKSDKVFKILYFWGVGALFSLFCADITGIGPDRMRYYHYFAVHSYIVLSILYFLIIHEYKINLKALVNAICILFPISLAVHLLDVHSTRNLKINWMFLGTPPNVSSLLNLLPKGGWPYYFSFVLLSIFVMIAFYLPWGISEIVSSVKNDNKSVSF